MYLISYVLDLVLFIQEKSGVIEINPLTTP